MKNNRLSAARGIFCLVENRLKYPVKRNLYNDISAVCSFGDFSFAIKDLRFYLT